MTSPDDHCRLFLQLRPLCFEVSRAEKVVTHQHEGCNNFVLVGEQLVYCRNEQLLYGFLVKVGSSALRITVEFMVALVNGEAILCCGVPDLRAVLRATLAAFDTACEHPDPAVAVFVRLAPSYSLLNHAERYRPHYGFVDVINIILGNFTLVDVLLFGEIIRGVAFLQKSFALVFFVVQHSTGFYSVL